MSEPTYPNGSAPDQVPGEQATPAPGAPADQERAEKPGPTVHDRRRIDPKTGQPRQPAQGSAPQGAAAPGEPDGAQAGADDSRVGELEGLVAERTADLQRLQAEYANYKKRVDRDRSLARQGGIEAVVLDLLPVLDSVEAAREHDELVGGFKLVADELEKITTKYGLEVYGDVGEVFDPQIHEALMHMPYEGEITETTVSAVMQKGVRLNDRVLRPARVAVADPS